MRRLASVALTSACLVCFGCDAGAPPRWNLLLVTLDTTRADHLGSYGDAGAHTPHFDALAEEGVRFDQAWTAAPITAPAHATLLTGRYPVAHGVRDNGLFALPPREVTLAERLSAAGWVTGAAVGAFPLAARFGFDQGFAWYDDRVGPRFGPSPAGGRLFFDERPAGAVNEAALRWLEERARDPFFLWLHYYDPHQPLAPPAPWNQLFAADPYAGEIAYADESFGTIVARLRELGVWDRTLVVVTADHGEGIGEHEEATHSLLLYEGTLRVPLIVRVPGGSKGRVVAEPVSTVDVTPTVLELLGVALPEGLHGVSLVPAMTGQAPPPGRGLYAETLSPRLAHRWGELRAWREGSLKYIHGPRPELYDLASDAAELAPLSNRRTDGARLRESLAEFLARESQGSAPADAIDAETRQRLEALGYAAAGIAGTGEIVDELREGGVAPQDRARDVSSLSLAKALLLAGEPAAAQSPLDRLVADDPGNPRYRELRAEALLGVGDFAAALEDLEVARTAATSPRAEAALLLQLAAIERVRGDRAASESRIEASIALAPSAAAERLRAQLALEAGEGGEMRAALERALSLEPGFAPARLLLAIELDRSGDAVAAEREFEHALADQPYDSRAHYNHGVFLLGRDRLPEAHAAFARALALDPRYAAAANATADAAIALGRTVPLSEPGPTLAEWNGGSVTQSELDAWIRQLPVAARRAPIEGAARRTWYEGHLRARALQEMLLARAAERGAAHLERVADSEPAPVTTPARAERRWVEHWYRRARDPAALADARAELRRLAERLAAGEPFASLAREHSESQSRHVGGVLGWLGSEQLPRPAADVVFSLRPGILSEPVVVGPGLHVFRVGQVLPARAERPSVRPPSPGGGSGRVRADVEVAMQERERVVRASVTDAELRSWHARHTLRFATALEVRLERSWLPATADPDAEMSWLEQWAAGEEPDPATLRGWVFERGGGSEPLPWQTWEELSHTRPLAALLVSRLAEGEASPPYRVVLGDGTEVLEVMRLLDRREPVPRVYDSVAEEVARAWFASEAPERWQLLADEWLDAADYRTSLERFSTGSLDGSGAPATSSSSSSARSS